jgi:hypothetical protein
MAIQPQPDDGLWISGPMARDDRPEYSPASVVLDIRAALGRAGIDVDAAPNQLHTASIAAADLLRALGVKPTTAPRRAS